MPVVDEPGRRTFTILCRKKGGVEIKDGLERTGGNVRTAARMQLAWTNATNQATCYLKFRLVSRDEHDGKQWWPFVEEPGDMLLALPHGEPTVRTLDAVPVTRCVEYVVLGADGEPLLDPIIIIDPD